MRTALAVVLGVWWGTVLSLVVNATATAQEFIQPHAEWGPYWWLVGALLAGNVAQFVVNARAEHHRNTQLMQVIDRVSNNHKELTSAMAALTLAIKTANLSD